MSRIRVGLVGAGTMGSVHAQGWQECAGAELVAVHGAADGTAAALAERHDAHVCDDLDDLLERVDVVDVCAPTHLHHEIVLAAARAGRDVVCEKPLGRTPAQAEEIVSACAEAEVRLLVAHVVRFFPEYAAMRAAVRAGQVGEPAVVRLTRSTYQPAKPGGNWYLDEEKSGGLTMDLMIHDLDYARWIAGEVESVYARSVRSADPDSTIDHAVAILRHTSGAITHVEGSWAYPKPAFVTRGEVAGTLGVVNFDSDRDSPLRPRLRQSATTGDVPIAGSPVSESPYTTQLRHFSAVLRGEEDPIVTAADGLAAVRMATAAAESIRTGAPVSVEVTN
ncbi:Gfo/Idh/MocA family oxidoreductase [Spiractinospora alimapuensis]|uniref:Gfo/Idh/MocA family protein n=1 Tax=Spiractinospora alimapuensis TaxID=2820884 RepID=UPI001F2A877C|nr:Gfo/Idh/MocA family oxidoreductase [Spiractinospora alimapuensis]QVQ52453.1 Gfo/Idh/MocA family oxidoreductase [Spiractinospora alimapuensis]